MESVDGDVEYWTQSLVRLSRRSGKKVTTIEVRQSMSNDDIEIEVIVDSGSSQTVRVPLFQVEDLISAIRDMV